MASPDKFSEILKQIKENTLERLDLYGNRIGDAGAMALATALQTNTSLKALDLRLNKIGDAGAKDLATALHTNTSLTTLDLHGNIIRDAGAKDLATALLTNISLTTLDLHGNVIGDAGAMALADMLRHNKTLRRLELSDGGRNGTSEILTRIKARTKYNILLNGLIQAKEFCETQNEAGKPWWGGQDDRFCKLKVSNTFHTFVEGILEYDTDKDQPIFTTDERKIMDSCLQSVSGVSIAKHYYDPTSHVKTESESDSNWKKGWTARTIEEGPDKGKTIYTPKPSSIDTPKPSSIDNVDFLPKKRRSVNRKKSNKQKKVIKSRIGKKSKRGSARVRRVKSKSKSLSKKIKRVSVRRAITSPRRKNKSKSVPARERTKK